MKKLLLPVLLALATAAAAPAVLAQTACPAAPGTTAIPGTGSGTASAPVTTIVGTTTLRNNTIYLMSGQTVVPAGAELIIPAGTIVRCDSLTKATLVVARGGRLTCNGTANQPIVFTSADAPGRRQRGDWGGIVLLGRSHENIPGDPNIEGVLGFNYGPGLTGGVDNAPVLNDDSGTLRYVRIEFPGILISQGNEINGLTMGAVGSGTTIENVQVSFSGDDSFEWFGGTVNARNLISFNGLDDDFDVDNGFSGRVQFGLALRDPRTADASQSNAIESDNNSTGGNVTPQTSPVFSNMTFLLPAPPAGTTLNPLHRQGLHLRRNSATSVFNSVLVGYTTGLYLQASNSAAPFPTPNTETQLTSGNMVLKNNVIAAATNFQVQTGSTLDLAAYYNDPARANSLSTVAALNLNADNFGFNGGNCGHAANCMPAFLLPANSPLVGGAAFADAKLTGTGNGGANSGFAPVAYRGAFGPAGTPNWAAGWTNFNPQLTCYNRPGQTLANRDVPPPNLAALAVAPNPATGPALLQFDLRAATTATVTAFDALGRPVAVLLASGRLGPGPHALALPATLPNGVYLARVTTAEASQAVRFVVNR